MLIIICGLSFSGKTTLAKAMIERFGHTEVDVDETKFRLYGHNIHDEDLKSEDWTLIYTETDQQIEDLLTSGKIVIDASRNFHKTERDGARRIAAQAGAEALTIYVDTPEEIVRTRLRENRKTAIRRDVSDSDFEDVLRAMQPPDAEEMPIIFHYRAEIDAWLEENAQKLAQK